MATIIKQETIVIKCSNPPKTDQSIKCMAIEANSRIPINMIWVYSNTENLSADNFMPSNYLQMSLSDTLNYFPMVAGRLTEDEKGNAIIHLTNEGVLYTEAECSDQSLDYFIPRTKLDEGFDYEHINASDLAVHINDNWTGPCVSIQVTRFKCNSVILSLSASHCLFDAQSVAFFINTWASAKPPSPMPTFDKSFVLHPDGHEISSTVRPKYCVFNRDLNSSIGLVFDQEQQQRVICKVYHFSINELENIKKEASKNLPNSIKYISTYDALFAHMILVISQATQTSLTDNIKILQAFDGRSSFVASQSSIVLNYFGSFAFWLCSKLPSGQEHTLSSLAQLIHEMHSKQSEHSLRDYNAYLMSDDGDARKNQIDADIFNRDFHCTSWRKMNMLGGKFGNSGYPIYSGPTRQPYTRFFLMMDAHATDQSVNIILGLKEQDYQRMVQQNILHKYR